MEKTCKNCGTPITKEYCEDNYPEVCEHWTPKKPKTNADRIRSSDDKLATMLHAVKMGYRPWCDYHCENEGDDGCDNCIKKWLQQPAEGE